jgi:preprotein translocase subunit SecA
MTVQFRSPEELAAVEEPEAPRNVQYQHTEFSPGIGDDAGEALVETEGEVAVAERPQPFVRGSQKVGRNDPCPCGSGKKYKQCHGRLT